MLRSALAALFLLASCGHYHAQRAERPLTHRELASRGLTVTPKVVEPTFAAAFAQALDREGFQVVDHPAYRGDLDVTVTTRRGRAGPVTVAVARSDGFFVEEARVPGEGGEAAAAWLAKTLSTSQRMADFIRNSGLPQQTGLGGR